MDGGVRVLTESTRLTMMGCVALSLACVGCGKKEEAPAPQGKTTEASTPNPTPVPAAMGEVDVSGVELAPGWLVEMHGADGSQATILAPTASFRLGSGESLHPSVGPDGLTVEYTGVLAVPEPGRYRFIVEAEGGEATLRVFDSAGREVAKEAPSRVRGRVETEWAQLVDEAHTVLVTFNRRGGVPARLRTMWEKQGIGAAGFVAEVIPTELLSVPAHATKAAARATLSMEGRVLLGELNCISCHAADESMAQGVIKRQAPLLGEIGKRASPAWIARWISHPQDVKPHAPMPEVYREDDPAEIEAITHFLVSLSGPVAGVPVATEANVIEQGRRLFHNAGCVACHGGLESPAAAYGEVSLPDETPAYDAPHAYGDLGGKWNASALAEFLKDPRRIRPGGRMPSMDLTDEEADLIATYLVSHFGAAEASGFVVDPTKVQTGRAAFAARGCANCHEIGNNQAPVASTLTSQPLMALLAGKGPMDPADTSHVHYNLTDRQRAALRVAIEDLQRGASHPAPLDDAYMRIGALGCMNCHTKDGRGGLAESIRPYFTTRGEAELGDEGRLPPRLSGVGFKLHTPWLREVLTEAGRARPYMHARMPQFGEEQVGPLVEELAAIDGIEPNSDATEPQATNEMVLAGRKLVGESGLNCISCHVFGDLAPAGTPGPDLTRMAERIRYAWWHDYVLNPPRFKPGTRMPVFYFSGVGTVTDVYGGDSSKQTDAIWAYLSLGSSMPVPDGVETGAGLALRVGDEPVVFRTFMEDAGTRAIAVGFPIGTHFAFDAERVRLVDAWRGDFIDATSAWKGRGGQNAGGQGTIFWKAPPGPALAIGQKPASWPSEWHNVRFRGYRLDESRAPVFMYDITPFDEGPPMKVEEQFRPIGATGDGFRWTLTLTGSRGQTIWHRAGAGDVTVTGGDMARAEGLIQVTPAGDGPVTISEEVHP